MNAIYGAQSVEVSQKTIFTMRHRNMVPPGRLPQPEWMLIHCQVLPFYIWSIMKNRPGHHSKRILYAVPRRHEKEGQLHLHRTWCQHFVHDYQAGGPDAAALQVADNNHRVSTVALYDTVRRTDSGREKKVTNANALKITQRRCFSFNYVDSSEI